MNDKQIEIYSNQIEFCYGNVEWTHKIHEKATDIFTKIHAALKWSQLILSYFLSYELIRKLAEENAAVSYFLAVVSILVSISGTVIKAYDFESRIKRHRDTAMKLLELREDYRSLKTDLMAGRYSEQDFIAQRDALQEKLIAVYNQSPRTFSLAYNRAVKAFRRGEVTFEHLGEH